MFLLLVWVRFHANCMTYVEDEDVSFFDSKFNITCVHFFFGIIKTKESHI